MENPSLNQHFRILLTFLFLLFSLNSSISATSDDATSKSNIKFIKTSCNTTRYPSLCMTSLASHSDDVKNNPKLLAHLALSVALDTALSTSSSLVKLSKSPRGMKHGDTGAMTDCLEELTDSVEELRRSMAEMNQIKGANFETIMNDVQTWVSAALTEDDTCTEGFGEGEFDGHLKNIVRGRILNTAHLTSNALDLINDYASIHT